MRCDRLILCGVLFTAQFARTSAVADESVIWAFRGYKGQGSQPLGNVIARKSGFYGTTSGLGSAAKNHISKGTAFKISPSQNGWKLEDLHVFQGGTDGANPFAGLVEGANGRLYGTTVGGGATSLKKGAYAAGTVFELTPPASSGGKWSETIIYAFPQYGLANPAGALTVGPGGGLYGTAEQGGSAGFGGVFALSPPAKGGTTWTETTLYNFSGGLDGGQPVAALITDASGALYGTTRTGGINIDGDDCSGLGNGSGCGVVFKLTPPEQGQTAWSESVLYSFTGGADGAEPLCALVSDSSGALYGTTEYGGIVGNPGVVFKLTPPGNGQTQWTDTTIYQFQGYPTDGEFPVAGLVFGSNGSLYGTTLGGGTEDGGTVFDLSPPQAGQTSWTESIVYTFQGGAIGKEPTDGAEPAASLLIDDSGNIIGTTSKGGGQGPGGAGNYGTVFEISP